MKEIRKIEPIKLPSVEQKKVAAYARASMVTDRMEHSLSQQVSYYSELIQKTPGWTFAGVYSDNGISGRDAKKRHGFQEMLSDAEAGKIDIILTKSISRFARNTVDLLKAVRHLKELGVEVRFEQEHINTLSGEGELMLSILASFAQAESESIGRNAKWKKEKMAQAGINVNGAAPYGYRMQDHQMVVIPEEAEIVKKIFSYFLDEDLSDKGIADRLNALGISSPRGYVWDPSAICGILHNVAYVGDLLQGKTFYIDEITKKLAKNRGERPMYLVENDHEAIISREDFARVKEVATRHAMLGSCLRNPETKSVFAGKIFCGQCGKAMHRCSYRTRGVLEPVWKCGNKKKKCSTPHLLESELKAIFCNLIGDQEFLPERVEECLDRIVLNGDDTLIFTFKDGRSEEYHYRRRPVGSPETNPRPSDVRDLEGKLYCSKCGKPLRSRLYHEKGRYYIWMCNKCLGGYVRHDSLKNLILKAQGTNDWQQALSKIEQINTSHDLHTTIIYTDGHEETYELKPLRRKKEVKADGGKEC